MGNTNSTEANLHQRKKSNNSISDKIEPTADITATATATTASTSTITDTSTSTASSNPQLSVTEPPNEESSTQPVPVVNNKTGWVSSTTGAASPWFNSYSSSTSSHHPHRASISGPYYRARGMSVTARDSENDEDLMIPSTASNIIVNNNTAANTTANAANTAAGPANLATMPAQGVPTIITWTQGGNNVYVTGTFNGWKHKIKLVKSTHDFNAVLELPPGTHRLKFIVDDEWKCSNDLETATDPDGNLVNYLQVMDEEQQDEEEEDDDLVSTSTNDEYSSIIPPELLKISEAAESELEMKPSIEWEKKQPQPPTLPPHLDKVLLNSQTVSEEDNSVLYEPNHVTLNHLYACSIKDNVMALATTTRYRKKYVTTMYYRPVLPKD
ncbi:hypothetical protein G6F57_007785 [Rhizopus arrhizus]|nr:hypothetical protein G6F24_005580 [Rhizopus arrhizus]KAG1420492.1 hypothetical protein G6F58_004166 [Rhizopus delemar]KAG0911855.1 hypothetical protein G6F33_006614 [Rhizopus arrhizus]KAG0949855.1 hypothetical protein G6F30_002014 [Rhizopus arrhizus]KAG0950125.1 hypothetical protein G6F32_005288 [Rhizopus arrhizus]